MMGHRAPLKSGDEYDGLTRAKRYHRWRPGDRKALKRAFNKRQRKTARRLSVRGACVRPY